MIHRKLITFVGTILLVVIAGLAIAPALLADDYKLPPASTRQNLNYATDIRPIFEKNCFKCHGENKQQRHLRLDSLEAVLKGCEDGPVIFPGKSDRGDLILEVTGMGDHDMPPWPSAPPLLSREHSTTPPPAIGDDGMPLPKPLTAVQIGLIRAWIDQGAK
jgi:mono/diheme cytochrome c family protein